MVMPIPDRRRLLKIKLKSLAAEARIIRNEELKARHSKRPEVQQLRAEMHEHRVKELREEARSTLLAYSYIRGMKYRDIEPRSDWGTVAPWPAARWAYRNERILAMVAKYGSHWKLTADMLKTWLSAEPNRENPPRKPRVPYTGPRTRPPQRVIDVVMAAASYVPPTDLTDPHEREGF